MDSEVSLDSSNISLLSSLFVARCCSLMLASIPFKSWNIPLLAYKYQDKLLQVGIFYNQVLLVQNLDLVTVEKSGRTVEQKNSHILRLSEIYWLIQSLQDDVVPMPPANSIPSPHANHSLTGLLTSDQLRFLSLLLFFHTLCPTTNLILESIQTLCSLPFFDRTQF